MPPRRKNKKHPEQAAAERFACFVARLMDDSKCEEVVVLDLRGVSPLSDFIVIASGTSERQIHSVADEVRDWAKVEHHARPAFDGVSTGGWVVADFFDVVVHLFSLEMRAYYDLDSLWSDAKRVDWRAATTPGQSAKLAGRKHVPTDHT